MIYKLCIISKYLQRAEKYHNEVQFKYDGQPFNRGDVVFAFSTDGHFIVINWKDKKHVLLLSTLVSITNQMGMCQRHTVDHHGKHKKFMMSRPLIVEDYSSKMFYVDKG
ncbi:MAG: hypothetical protein GY816_02835 [Cytophagales bacterium]|nr:hypothetical protein [Cytophagales bacterium]